MTRLWADGLPIEIQRASREGEPARLRLQGKVLVIDRIWQHIEVQTDWWADEGGTDREVYSLTTLDPPLLMTIYCDRLRAGQWFLERIYD